MTDIIRGQAAIKEGWGGRGGEGRGAGHEKKKKMDNITTIVINRSKGRGGREGARARECSNKHVNKLQSRGRGDNE